MPDLPENSPPPAADLTGQELGDYALIRRLGRGGMADVYLAEQRSLRRNVALKILKPELATDQSYVKRFQREAQAVAALVQANIVQIYEVGCEAGYYYIAQEYVRGRNLKQYLDRYGAVEPVMAINVLRQSALALQKANELDVVHRDIKPENIMLSTKGEVKITDFGLARVNRLENQGEKALTQIGVTMGTPLYMSPEQVGGKKLDHRSDIYSLGVTAYHMLAGEPPFDGDTALAIAVQHVNNPAPRLDKIRPDIPVELATVVNKMMEKKPSDRPLNADALLKSLREIPFNAEEDWEFIVEKLTVGPSSDDENISTSLSQSQLAATIQLQQVMLGNTNPTWRSRWFVPAILLIGILGVAAGMLAASLTQPESLLTDRGMYEDSIARKGSVKEQYRSAMFSETRGLTIASLKKVIDYFPLDQAQEKEKTTQYFHRLAWLRMAELHLQNSEFQDAEKLFLVLSETEELNESFQVAGFAGLAIAYFNMKDEDLREREKTRNELLAEAIQAVDNRESMLNRFLSKRYQEVVSLFPKPPSLALPSSVQISN